MSSVRWRGIFLKERVFTRVHFLKAGRRRGGAILRPPQACGTVLEHGTGAIDLYAPPGRIQLAWAYCSGRGCIIFSLTFRIVFRIVFVLVRNMKYIIRGEYDGKRRRDLRAGGGGS